VEAGGGGSRKGLVLRPLTTVVQLVSGGEGSEICAALPLPRRKSVSTDVALSARSSRPVIGEEEGELGDLRDLQDLRDLRDLDGELSGLGGKALGEFGGELGEFGGEHETCGEHGGEVGGVVGLQLGREIGKINSQLF